MPLEAAGRTCNQPEQRNMRSGAELVVVMAEYAELKHDL